MDALRKERMAHQALAARPTGISARFSRVWPNVIGTSGAELDMAQLPIDALSYSEMQDPVSGVPYFVPGISLVDGEDLIQ